MSVVDSNKREIFNKDMNHFNKIYVNYPNVYKKITKDGYMDKVFELISEVITNEMIFAFKSKINSFEHTRKHWKSI